MRFIKDSDYTVLLRNEIKDILLEDYTDAKLHRAEEMAIAQVKNFLHGEYNTDSIFKAHEGKGADERNSHIVMVVIDCTLYHLYTSLAPNRIPQHRADRYQDVLNWLRDVGRGKTAADLPRQKDKAGQANVGMKISSEYANENNRW